MKWFWVVFLAIIPSVVGVTIHGSVYDFGLNTLPNAIVEINSTPSQLIVASNGTYSFAVLPGTYTLKARHTKSDSDIEENISALTEGSYVLDLILLPSVGNEEALLKEQPDVPLVEDIIQEKPATSWLVWVVVFALLAYLLYKVSRKAPKVVQKIVHREVVKEVAVAEELQKVLEFIEKEGGRTTQKDIRKQFPYSEAKISLMIDELEAKGLIKKVKKGRGNIIIKA